MRLLKTKEVLEMLNISSVTLWRMVKRGDLPKPLKITDKSPNLYKQEWIEDYVNSRVGA